jgi:hypothetical protein
MELPAVAIAIPMEYGFKQEQHSANMNTIASMIDFLLPVLSASFLITGNTVRASCLVLPKLAYQVGMGVSTTIFLGTFPVALCTN